MAGCNHGSAFPKLSRWISVWLPVSQKEASQWLPCARDTIVRLDTKACFQNNSIKMDVGICSRLAYRFCQRKSNQEQGHYEVYPRNNDGSDMFIGVRHGNGCRHASAGEEKSLH